MKVICDIYRSSKKEGMYLYVAKADGLERVPEPLLAQFGTPQQAITLVLEPGRKLAHANADKVLAELEEKGFYLQMPPVPEAYMQDIHDKNDKLPR